MSSPPSSSLPVAVSPCVVCRGRDVKEPRAVGLVAGLSLVGVSGVLLAEAVARPLAAAGALAVGVHWWHVVGVGEIGH